MTDDDLADANTDRTADFVCGFDFTLVPPKPTSVATASPPPHKSRSPRQIANT
jgi:hypothetical protein